ncbi:hypothetical protein B0H13DRAFT_2046408, partial [Mycena leptocephala]
MCIEGSSIFLFAFSFMLCSMRCCLWRRCPRQGQSSFRRVLLTRPSNVLASILFKFCASAVPTRSLCPASARGARGCQPFGRSV